MEEVVFKHIPIMLNEVIEGLNIKPDGIYVDGTLGGAGHSFEIVKRLEERGRLIGIDQDEMAILASEKKLSPFKNRVTIVRSNYRRMTEILKNLEIEKVDGILLDLGVSSYQLDTAERGFSYMEDAPLDMRMDRRSERTAKDIVNSYSEKDLTRILKEFGEEKFASKIAKNIVVRREEKEISTTFELVDIIKTSIPAKNRMVGGHPAKRTFQAIRIELNEELTVLSESIEGMIDVLKDGGRLAIITFHSLEDRIVKNTFKKIENPCICPPNFPICVCGKKSGGRVIGRKPLMADEKELELNSRAKSAKLRIFERSEMYE